MCIRDRLNTFPLKKYATKKCQKTYFTRNSGTTTNRTIYGWQEVISQARVLTDLAPVKQYLALPDIRLRLRKGRKINFIVLCYMDDTTSEIPTLFRDHDGKYANLPNIPDRIHI